MPDGQLTYPDYGVYPSQVITPEGDLGEIAAKLAHPRYRREGRILSFADCSPGLDGWQLNHDAFIEYSVPGATGPGSASGNAHIQCTNADAGTTAILKYVPTTLDRRMGFEYMLALDTNNVEIIFELTYWEALTARIGRIKIICPTGDVYYQNNAGTYTQFAAHNVFTYIRNWINVKLVTDYTLNQYIRFYINNRDYDMGFALRGEGTLGEYGTFLAIYGYNYTGSGIFRFNIDSLLITTNER